MAKKKKKLTTNQEAYNKELKRIKAFIRRAEKRGYVFDYTPPERGERVTNKKLKAIKEVKPDFLYSKAKYYTYSGYISGELARFNERSNAAKKAAKTRAQKNKLKEKLEPTTPEIPIAEEQVLPEFSQVVYDNVMEELDKWEPMDKWTKYFKQKKEHDKNVIKSVIEGAIQRDGLQEVAQRLEDHAIEINELLQEILYGSGGGDINKSGRININLKITRLAQIIIGRTLTTTENKDLTEQAESFDSE